MITIVNPNKNIISLWNKYSYNANDVFRMMNYVISCEVNDTIILHNMVTGHTVSLDHVEKAAVLDLPRKYEPSMEQLIDCHFLVPIDYDEYQYVVGMLIVLRKLISISKGTSITHYTILPTTSCNARCYYCFEQGIKQITMTPQTINNVLEFIDAHCGIGKSIRISWFGGEPTVASKQISKICEGLQSKGIDFASDITTNGYLFDSELVKLAVEKWNLKRAMICLDGTEKTYNRVKAYINAADNPFYRVIHNIGLLVDNHVQVSVRMNFDLNNASEFVQLIAEIDKFFHNNPLISVSVHPIVGEYLDNDGVVAHASDSWFEKKVVELNDIARKAGYLKSSKELPSLNISGCQASDDSSITITPEGNLVKCPEQIGTEQIVGNVKDGIVNHNMIQLWKEISTNKRCKECCLFPDCVKLNNCATRDTCCYYSEMFNHYKTNIINTYMRYLENQSKGVTCHVV